MRGRTAAAPLRTEICHLRHIRACFRFRGERPHSIICRKGENGQPQNKNGRRIQRKKPNRRLLNLYIRVCQKILWRAHKPACRRATYMSSAPRP